MWLTYHVLGIQINHSINELLSCRVPAGASKPGLQAWSYMAGACVVELVKTHPEAGMSLKAERCDRVCLPSLSTWPGCPAVRSQGLQHSGGTGAWPVTKECCYKYDRNRTVMVPLWTDTPVPLNHGKGETLWGAVWFCWLYVKSTAKGSVSAELVRDAALPLIQRSSYRTLSCVLVCL